MQDRTVSAAILLPYVIRAGIEQGNDLFPYSRAGVHAAALLISLRTPVHKNEQVKNLLVFYAHVHPAHIYISA